VARGERQDAPVVARHLELPGPGEARSTPHEGDPGALEPLDLARVVPVGGEGGAPRQDRSAVDLAGHGLGRAGDRARRREHGARAQERLGRHARPVRALAADELLLDDDDAQPGAARAVGDVLPDRTRADDHDVVRAVLVLLG
jgi:hypothetical protein